MIDRLLMKLRARDEISADEEEALRAAVGEIVRHPADVTFIPAGKLLHSSTLLIEGLIARYKDLSNGERQITELHVPGDFADLHSFTLKFLDHSIMTVTPSVIVQVPHEKLQAITENHPHLARVLWFMTNLDAAIHREWVVSLGRRSALKRTAHLFCELQLRLGIAGLATERGYALPITQTVLAECLGLTSVHVNRVLKELRERGLVEFRSGRVTILDLPTLRRLAEFDPAYLYLDKRPR
ncbi:CRP-like cAMP-binding protein [Sphingomonas naasensis]|uniref:Crp/Fnr family transcriptional regulator n=1 Tax=Sphingomonas naasensis TaxID=1344951 RepID=A0A4V3QXE0_9SPHN|nr:Crp/Fnr family transcriptional regulator [Sphingomonas naasensis]NIJ18891.1 CRP-like cAMP-binding protein [Sphingomonas naasensis]TGX46112.1 Crp/Fnr family transcriptional regulator [Sphingomonas naasensis]